MSPRKLTEDDKQEILEEYRNSEATTSTLAKSFEVSSSTISRFLKNKLSTVEYEDLIQQKRLARTPRGEKSEEEEPILEPSKAKAQKKSQSKAPQEHNTKSKKAKKVVADDDVIPELASWQNLLSDQVEQPANEPKPRRRRRSKTVETEAVAILDVTSEMPEVEVAQLELEAAPAKLVLDKVRSKSAKSMVETVSKSERLILKRDRLELDDEEDDEDEMDLIALREMLGEDLEDINDDDDDDDEEDDDDDDDTSYLSPAAGLSNVQILPLSQASLPRTCYLVIDRSAELIVKPLAEFADLGAIPDGETSQTTLPVFDNHRIAKRFSHRRERVIKVPDGQMLQKASHHLQEKGITRLLIDGQIYSLSH
jgi:transposase-like protein